MAQATATLKSNTQTIVGPAVLPLGRRYKADWLYHLTHLPGDWYTNTLHGNTKPKEGNKYSQVFANNSYFAAIYPMDTKKKVGEALCVFCQEFGVPEHLTMDGAPYQVGQKPAFIKEVQIQGIDFQVIKPE